MRPLALWLAACAGDDPATAPDPTADTAAVPGGSASCAQQPGNTLRLDCAVVRTAVGPVEVVLTDAEGETLSFAGDPALGSQTIVAWDLHAGSAWSWRVTDGHGLAAEGVVQPGPVPDSAAVSLLAVVSGPTSVDRVVLPAGCGGPATMVTLDGRGRVRWYQPVDGLGGIGGFDVTDRGSVVVIEQRSKVREVGFDGALRYEGSVSEGDLPRLVHHAALGRDDRTVVLDASSGVLGDGLTYVIDGLTTIEGGVAAHTWDLLEVLDPVGLPSPPGLSYWVPQMAQAVDYAHENGLDLAADGDPILSFKHLDTVIRVESDPSDPELGQVRWALVGDERGVAWPDRALALGSSIGVDPSFQYPHHPWVAPNGDLLLMDSGRPGDQTRVLRIAIDEQAGTADVIAAWPLDAACPVHSSAHELPDGTVLAACASTRELFELDATGIRKRSRLVCSDGEDSRVLLTRAEPLPR